MKFLSSFVVIILLSLTGYSQNLVPNPSFENYTTCPIMQGQIHRATPWVKASQGIGDYYNQCSPTVTTPNNSHGSQTPRTGVAYAGIQTANFNALNYATNYLQVPLIAPLGANMCYHFEMWVNLGEYSNCTSDNIGAYFFSGSQVYLPIGYTLPFTPQIANIPGNYFNVTSWVMITGDFMATGGENYMIIGNFDDPSLLNLLPLHTPLVGLPLCYAYIDDVSLTPVPDCIVLPIELLDFSAVQSGDVVDLFWSTASEINNDYFSIESSKDAENFSELKKVNGAGNSTEKLKYNYKDEKPLPGISYYRLKQVDYDGAFSYSETLQINFSNPGKDISIYPNPCLLETKLFLPDDLKGETKVKLYDSQGKLTLIKSEYNIDSTYLLNFGNLDKGVYYISVENNFRILSNQKLIVE